MHGISSCLADNSCTRLDAAVGHWISWKPKDKRLTSDNDPMKAGFIILLIFSALAAWSMLRGRSANRFSGRKAGFGGQQSPPKRYSAVKITHGLNRCLTAEQCRNRVWLSSEAPAIPLVGCDEEQCECRYVHLDDRRNNEDRRNPYAPIDPSIFNEAMRSRQARGRRAAD